MQRISSYGKEDAEQAFSKVYQLIAAYGRKVRESKKSNKLIETTKPNIRPVSIPRGNYFTVHQAAQICHITSKQIRACIRKGLLEAFDLPGYEKLSGDRVGSLVKRFVGETRQFCKLQDEGRSSMRAAMSQLQLSERLSSHPEIISHDCGFGRKQSYPIRAFGGGFTVSSQEL